MAHRLNTGAEDDEPLTDEEREALREADKERKAGRMKPIESLDIDLGK